MTRSSPNPTALDRGLNRAGLRLLIAASVLSLTLAGPLDRARAAEDPPTTSPVSVQLITTMMANEQIAADHKDNYSYISRERSDRTGGHLWTERVVETNQGRVRMLLSEDGHPISPARIAQERGRLAAIIANPSAFIRRSRVAEDDEAHARRMLSLATKAFLFDDPRPAGPFLRIDYRPNPAYQTQTIEERVIHAMTGTLLIEPTAMRLHSLDGRLPEDVDIGYGILGVVRAGSNFSTTRDHFEDSDWKTTQLDTAIDGRIIFFKSIAKDEHSEHVDFTRVPNDITLAQAVALVEQ